MDGGSTLLLTVIGLALGLLSVVLPMTPWRMSPLVAESLAVVALAILAISMVLWLRSIWPQLSAPRSYAQVLLSWPETRATLRYATVLLVLLILVEWAQVRPMYKEIQSMQTTLQRYVLPRHLTEEQIATISGYLARHDPQDITLVANNNGEEASAYRGDIQNALTKGGWRVSTGSGASLAEGITVTFSQTRQSAERAPDPKHPTADALIMEALRLARIPFGFASGSSSSPANTANSLTLSVGLRRMDDGDLVARKRDIERLRKMIDEGENNPNY